MTSSGAEVTSVRQLGTLKDKVWIADDFDDTDHDIIDSFENSDLFPA